MSLEQMPAPSVASSLREHFSLDVPIAGELENAAVALQDTSQLLY